MKLLWRANTKYLVKLSSPVFSVSDFRFKALLLLGGINFVRCSDISKSSTLFSGSVNTELYDYSRGMKAEEPGQLDVGVTL
jgi:hypothetical protein